MSKFYEVWNPCCRETNKEKGIETDEQIVGTYVVFS